MLFKDFYEPIFFKKRKIIRRWVDSTVSFYMDNKKHEIKSWDLPKEYIEYYSQLQVYMYEYHNHIMMKKWDVLNFLTSLTPEAVVKMSLIQYIILTVRYRNLKWFMGRMIARDIKHDNKLYVYLVSELRVIAKKKPKRKKK